MEQKTIFFNTDLGPNGRRTTCKGGVDIVRYENGTTPVHPWTEGWPAARGYAPRL